MWGAEGDVAYLRLGLQSCGAGFNEPVTWNIDCIEQFG